MMGSFQSFQRLKLWQEKPISTSDPEARRREYYEGYHSMVIALPRRVTAFHFIYLLVVFSGFHCLIFAQMSFRKIKKSNWLPSF